MVNYLRKNKLKLAIFHIFNFHIIYVVAKRGAHSIRTNQNDLRKNIWELLANSSSGQVVLASYSWLTNPPKAANAINKTSQTVYWDSKHITWIKTPRIERPLGQHRRRPRRQPRTAALAAGGSGAWSEWDSRWPYFARHPRLSPLRARRNMIRNQSHSSNNPPCAPNSPLNSTQL